MQTMPTQASTAFAMFAGGKTAPPSSKDDVKGFALTSNARPKDKAPPQIESRTEEKLLGKEQKARPDKPDPLDETNDADRVRSNDADRVPKNLAGLINPGFLVQPSMATFGLETLSAQASSQDALLTADVSKLEMIVATDDPWLDGPSLKPQLPPMVAIDSELTDADVETLNIASVKVGAVPDEDLNATQAVLSASGAKEELDPAKAGKRRNGTGNEGSRAADLVPRLSSRDKGSIDSPIVDAVKGVIPDAAKLGTNAGSAAAATDVAASASKVFGNVETKPAIKPDAKPELKPEVKPATISGQSGTPASGRDAMQDASDGLGPSFSKQAEVELSAPVEDTPNLGPAATAGVRASADPAAPVKTDRSLTAADRVAVVRQIADRVELLVASRPREGVTIHLDPKDFGSLTLVVKSHGNEVDARILTNHDAVRAALETSRPQLNQALESRGLTLGNMSVGQDQAQQQNGGNPLASHAGPSGQHFAPSGAAIVATDWRSHAKSSAGVDLWI